jgi:hypothetical protein
MSTEVFQILISMNQNELNTQLALQCAPLLTNHKISNLLIVDNSMKNKVVTLFLKTSISVYILYETEKKVTFLLYRKEELEFYLQNKRVRDLMFKLGYKEFGIKYILRELRMKYKAHMIAKDFFPHEIGLILEYPADDVNGFIENEGKNYLYIGYWKVYNNLNSALAKFEKYNMAKETLIRMFSQGVDVNQILDIYVPNNNKKEYKKR